MLFQNGDFASKFCLVGLEAQEHAEIARLIKDNGGKICGTREPPVVTFGDYNSVCGAGEPIFHINFIRECVKQQTVLQLIEFMIEPLDYYGCVQSIFTSGARICPSHSSNSKPSFTSSQIDDGSQVTGANKSSITLIEHSYACRNAGDNQDANKSVEKRVSVDVLDKDLRADDSPPETFVPISTLDVEIISSRGVPKNGRNATITCARSVWGSFINDDSDSLDDEAGAPGSPRAEAPTRNYARWEQCRMVEYLITHNCIEAAKGLSVWKQMKRDGILKHRTAQSLNNHFRRSILPIIDCFEMNERSLKKFRSLESKK